MLRFLLPVLVALAAALPATRPAAANDIKLCDAASGDASIAACSRQIASGKWKGRHLSNLFQSRGAAYSRKAEYVRAILDFDDAIRIDRTNANSYVWRGEAHVAQGDHDRAIRDFDEAIRLNPRMTVSYADRGVSYVAKGDYDRAIRDFDEAIRLDPKRALSYVTRGSSYLWKGDNERALRDFDEAIRLDPKNALGYAGRGEAHLNNREFDRALRDLDEAMRLKLTGPNLPVAYHDRGLAYAGKGDHDRALRDFDEAIRINPKLAIAYNGRGASYAARGDHERALRDFDEAIRLNPKLEAAHAGRNASQAAKGGREALNAPAATPPAAAKSAVTASAEPVIPTSAPPAAAPAGPRVALVIGNGNYAHATKLPNPANDATDIAQALRKLGFDVVEGRDLDRRGMEDKVRAFGRKLDNAGLALFFYAGHGMQVGGRNYLLPIDSKLERAGDLNFETIDVGNVLAQMEAEKRINLVFLDACRDNPLARSFSRSLGTRSTSVGQGLASIQSAIGTMIAYATQPDAVALDGSGRNSPFTTALLKHIATPGLDIGVLMRRVRTDVIAATREKQVPWDHSSLTGEVVLAR